VAAVPSGLSFTPLRIKKVIILKLKLNSVAFSPQANYTDRTAAACRRS
jgi:hypothetical protein